jgi:phycocyanin beta chain
MDAFSRFISQANEQGVFVSAEQLDALASIAKEGHKRLDIIDRITSNASAIVANAARALFVEQPQLIAPGGNAYTNRRMAACLRDMEIILRYVTYAMFVGDSSILDDRCLNGLRETYQALGVPGSSVAVAVQKMKEITIAIANDPLGVTPGDFSKLMSELACYFDLTSAAVVVEYATVDATGVLQRDANSVQNELSTERIGDDQPQSEVVNDTSTLKTTTEKNHPESIGSGIKAIDSKQVSAWISQEDGTELQEPLVVGTTYALNLRLAQDPGPSSTEVSEFYSPDSIDTQWIVTSSSVELEEKTTAIESISTTKLDSQTVWSVELFVPVVLREKPTISLKITPKKTDPLVTVLIFIYEKLYWQFSLRLTVKPLELKDFAYSAI